MSRLVSIVFVSLLLPLSAMAAAPQFQEGKDYVRYPTPVATGTGKV